MLYLHASIKVQPFRSAEFIRTLGQSIVPLFEKHGAKLVGSWDTAVGTQGEITDIWGFEGMEHFQSTTASLLRDQEWASVKQSVAGLVVEEKTKLLVPLKFSPLK